MFQISMNHKELKINDNTIKLSLKSDEQADNHVRGKKGTLSNVPNERITSIIMETMGMTEAQKTTLAPSHGNEGNKGVQLEIQQRAEKASWESSEYERELAVN